MKLYCKVKIEDGNGRRFRVTDPLTGMVDYSKKAVRLYNTKTIDVPAAIANRLLEQDPHLVSKKPFVEPAPHVDLMDGLEFEEKTEVLKLRSKRFIDFLDNVKGGAENAHENDLAEFGRKLEVDLPPLIGKTTKDTWLTILLDAAENYLGEAEVVELDVEPEQVPEQEPEPAKVD